MGADAGVLDAIVTDFGDLYDQTRGLSRNLRNVRELGEQNSRQVQQLLAGAEHHRPLIPNNELVLLRISSKISDGKFKAKRLELQWTSLADMAEDAVDYYVLETPWEYLFVGCLGIAMYAGEFDDAGTSRGFYAMVKGYGSGMRAATTGAPSGSVYPFTTGAYLGFAAITGNARCRDSAGYAGNGPLRTAFPTGTRIIVHWDPAAAGGAGEYYFIAHEDPQWGACP
jgi:hypothetical protein